MLTDTEKAHRKIMKNTSNTHRVVILRHILEFSGFDCGDPEDFFITKKLEHAIQELINSDNTKVKQAVSDYLELLNYGGEEVDWERLAEPCSNFCNDHRRVITFEEKV